MRKFTNKTRSWKAHGHGIAANYDYQDTIDVGVAWKLKVMMSSIGFVFFFVMVLMKNIYFFPLPYIQG